MINADKYTAVDKGLIPTGELKRREGYAAGFHKANDDWVADKASRYRRLRPQLRPQGQGGQDEVSGEGV